MSHLLCTQCFYASYSASFTAGSVLPAVAWPGMELDASDIEGYSDTSSHSSPGRETVVSSHQPSSSLSKYISGVWHNPAGGPPEVSSLLCARTQPLIRYANNIGMCWQK